MVEIKITEEGAEVRASGSKSQIGIDCVKCVIQSFKLAKKLGEAHYNAFDHTVRDILDGPLLDLFLATPDSECTHTTVDMAELRRQLEEQEGDNP